MRGQTKGKQVKVE